MIAVADMLKIGPIGTLFSGIPLHVVLVVNS